MGFRNMRLRAAWICGVWTVSLFDTQPYQVSKSRTKATRRATAPDTAPVVTSERWRVVLTKQPGVFHAALVDLTLGGIKTFCEQVGSARTIDYGLTVHGCLACIAAVLEEETSCKH